VCSVASDRPVFGLHHVQLAMPPGREDAARAFYSGLLGLAEIAKPPELAARGGAWFRAGTLELHLGVEDPFSPARKAHPGIVVHDAAAFDALAARLAGAGLEVRPDTLFPGHRRFYTDDAFGNRLEFLTRL
jgi:catechol 2,3-dioxygenase-like lactoylglutathione lyase family enzyme